MHGLTAPRGAEAVRDDDAVPYVVLRLVLKTLMRLLWRVRVQGLDNIHIKELPKLDASLAITQLPKIDASLAITQLPKIEADIGLKPMRVHMPMHTQICLSFLGPNLLKLSICGENMMITEPYVPHRAERCE